TGQAFDPVMVANLSGATRIATGSSHTCAIVAGGAVECWGADNAGQLGDGSDSNESVPVPVGTLSGVTDLATESDFTCALEQSGAVYCWGYNNEGELGQGGTSYDSTTPQHV